MNMIWINKSNTDIFKWPRWRLGQHRLLQNKCWEVGKWELVTGKFHIAYHLPSVAFMLWIFTFSENSLSDWKDWILGFRPVQKISSSFPWKSDSCFSDREATVFTVFQYTNDLDWVVNVFKLNWRWLLLRDLHHRNASCCFPSEAVGRQLKDLKWLATEGGISGNTEGNWESQRRVVGPERKSSSKKNLQQTRQEGKKNGEVLGSSTNSPQCFCVA